MKVFITGADGFIGSHLTETLVRLNYDVKCLSFYNSFNTWGWLDDCSEDVKKNFEVITGDIRDSELIKNAIKKTDIVFNLAALIGIPYSYKAANSYVDTNINGLLNVLYAAKEYNVKQIIHTSTSEVYGTPKFIPITEEHPVVGQSPYSASKIGADQIAISFHKSFNLPITILRPFNTYGPRQSNRAVIPTIITQILKNKNLNLGSTFPTRDFTYVQDTVNAMALSINNKKSIGEIINIGSNFEISIKNIVGLVSKITSKKTKIKKDTSRVRPKKSEVLRLLASNTKAKRILKWKPKYGGLKGFEKGLEKTISWFRSEKNLKKYKSNIYNY
jgi:NAD dependent epimerase/dehydratase